MDVKNMTINELREAYRKVGEQLIELEKVITRREGLGLDSSFVYEGLDRADNKHREIGREIARREV